MISPDLAISQARGAVIDSILTRGLVSASELTNLGLPYLSSYDKGSSEGVCGNKFPKVEDPERQEAMLAGGLYKDYESSLPVLIERADGNHNLFKDGWIITNEGIQIFEKRLNASFGVVCLDAKPTPWLREPIVPVEEFRYLLFPQLIWDEYKAISQSPKMAQIIRLGQVMRTLAFNPHLYNMPDYEGALRQIIQEEEQTVWFHVVKLPTPEDLTKSTSL